VYDPATGDKHITQDIYAGAYNARISYLTAVNGVLAFRATDGSGYALWVYDPTTGTATALLDKDGNGIPEPGAMIVMDDKAYFSQYNDGVLYVTDGTPAGTFKLTATSAPAVSPLPYGIDSSSGQALVVNHVLYFVGYESASGEELWKTDGTAAGTALVKDIYEGSSGSNIAYMTEMGGKLYFSAEGYTGSTSTGYELWVSDGTAAGTKPVGDINSASQGSFDWITTCNGQLFFAATNPTVGNELWVSDGDPTNATGTMLVKDIEPGTDSSAPSYPICFKSKLFFRAYNHLSGNELYSSNGTEAGTIVLDLNPIVGQGSSPQVKVATETSLYFTAEMPEFGTELWVTDGDLTSLSGTRRITDIDPGTGSSSPEYRGKVGSQLFFAMTNSTIGTELYRMDSTNNAVYLTKDLYSGSSDGASSSEHLVSGGRFYYSGGTSYHGQEVWYITPIYAPSAFTNGAPSDGSLGTAYNFTFSADGNPSPTFTVKVGSGALPGGLTLAADGTLTGTPTATGTFTFTVKASNSQGVYEKAYTLTIGSGGGATSAFTSSAPGTSMAGADYSFTFKANGTPAPTYAVTAGALPDGLTLDGDTGVLSGNATVSGTFTFTITATNSGGSATQNVTLILLPAPTLGLQTSQPTQHTYGITFPTGGGAPTGTVTFKDNTVAIPGCSQVNLVAGAASCAIERLLIGLHILTIEVDPGGTLPSGTLFSRRLSGLIFPIIIYNTYTN
jgi:ELWxxDGT repeat protein